MDEPSEVIEVAVTISRAQLESAYAPAADPISYARHLLKGIRSRSHAFPDLKIGDPVWTILLDLLVETRSGAHVSIQSACVGSGAPATTALRVLNRLEQRGYVVRQADPSDGRRVFVRLTEPAETQLMRCLQQEAGELWG